MSQNSAAVKERKSEKTFFLLLAADSTAPLLCAPHLPEKQATPSPRERSPGRAHAQAARLPRDRGEGKEKCTKGQPGNGRGGQKTKVMVKTSLSPPFDAPALTVFIVQWKGSGAPEEPADGFWACNKTDWKGKKKKVVSEKGAEEEDEEEKGKEKFKSGSEAEWINISLVFLRTGRERGIKAPRLPASPSNY